MTLPVLPHLCSMRACSSASLPAEGNCSLCRLCSHFLADLPRFSPMPCAVTCNGPGDRKVSFARRDSHRRQPTPPWEARCRSVRSGKGRAGPLAKVARQCF